MPRKESKLKNSLDVWTSTRPDGILSFFNPQAYAFIDRRVEGIVIPVDSVPIPRTSTIFMALKPVASWILQDGIITKSEFQEGFDAFIDTKSSQSISGEATLLATAVDWQLAGVGKILSAIAPKTDRLCKPRECRKLQLESVWGTRMSYAPGLLPGGGFWHHSKCGEVHPILTAQKGPCWRICKILESNLGKFARSWVLCSRGFCRVSGQAVLTSAARHLGGESPRKLQMILFWMFFLIRSRCQNSVAVPSCKGLLGNYHHLIKKDLPSRRLEWTCRSTECT